MRKTAVPAEAKLRCLIITWVLVIAFPALGQTNAQMTDSDPAVPLRGPYDAAQTLCAYCSRSTGTYNGPDGMNYYTDNGVNHALRVARTFTTGANAAGYQLTSVSLTLTPTNAVQFFRMSI